MRQVRETEATLQTPPIPAVALTAFAGETVNRKALKNGFQTCLTKPVQPRDLVTALASLAHPK